MNTRIVSLLTSDKLIGFGRETTEEVLKILKIDPKVWARRTNARLDILLPTEQDAKQMAGNVLTTKELILQKPSRWAPVEQGFRASGHQ